MSPQFSILTASWALLIASTSAATTYWSNYQPSLNTPVQTGDAWRRSTTALDSASLDSLGPGNKYAGIYLQGVIVRQIFTTEFSVPNEFTATHMTIPVTFAGNLNNTYVDIFVDQLENGSFVNLTRSLVRPSQLPNNGTYIDYTFEFGSNNTSIPALFDEAPLTLSPGNTYRLRVGGSGAGGVGGFLLRDSLVSGPDTNTLATASGAAATNNTDFQPAFAFNDGVNSAIPEPSSISLAFLSSLLVFGRRRSPMGREA